MNRIAQLTEQLIHNYKNRPGNKPVDTYAQELLQELTNQGIISAPELAFVEWQGVYEHTLVPIIWFDDIQDETPHCLNIYADGQIEVFA